MSKRLTCPECGSGALKLGVTGQPEKVAEVMRLIGGQSNLLIE